MKILTTLLLVSTATFSFSQSIAVKDGSEKFSTGSQPAILTTIYEHKLNDVISEWKKVMKDFKHEKVKESDNEVFGDNILVSDWGNNTADFYAKFEEDSKDKTIKMAVAVDLGGKYLTSSDRDKLKFVEKLVKDFAVKMTKEAMEGNVKDAGKLLVKLEDNEKDLVKDNKNYKDDIENWKGKIKKAEDDIKKNEEDQVKKKAEIEAQKK